jgi:hypothetical protein
MLEVNGVYNIDTIKVLQEIGVKKISFDCRPKSFNFIQLHAIKTLLTQINSDMKIGLLFDNEQIIGVQRILDDIKKDYSKEIDLYFYGINPKDYFNSIPATFSWEYLSTYNFNHLYDNPKFNGFIVSYNDVAPIEDISKQLDFLKSLSKERPLKISLDWDSEIQETLFDFCKFDSIILEINNKVETSFRSIDLFRFRDHIKKLAQRLGHS